MDVAEIRERLLRDESIRERVSRRAYEIYASRGYQEGREFEDWLQAEYEILPELIKFEQQRLGMAQAALEPEVRSEETVSLIQSASNAGTSATKGKTAKSSTEKGTKKPAAKKAPAQKAAANKKTTKSQQA
jgi:hypothetical protein